jgi:DNA-binding beta-propeller fold protein YncE
MNAHDGTITLVDPARQAAAGQIAVGGALEFAVADGAGHVFVNVEDRNEVAEIDIAGRQVIGRGSLSPCEGPTGLALDPDSHVLLSACANGKAVAVSSIDLHVIAQVPIGEHPDAVIFDDRNKRFLVPCGGNGVLTVVDQTADGSVAVSASIATAQGARTGAIDPETGKIYLPTVDYQPAKAGEKATAVPGSFHILVLGPR